MSPFGAECLAAALAAADPEWADGGACVAISGGLDSSVLLHAMAALSRARPFRLRALHVDHGLQPESAAWAEACRGHCDAAGIELGVVSLGLDVPRGSSIEAAAREARYAALAAELAVGERLLTAHHRDDQLETVLIQLLRGAGVAGLAAMPARARLGAGWQLRPLLDVDRATLRAYADSHAVAWHEDPMNEALRFDRGWLRARVLPAIQEHWPAASATVARSAAHCAEATRLLAEVAATDAQAVLDEGRLSLPALGGLTRERQVNLVRWWLRSQGLRAPPAARLVAAMPDFLCARRDGAPCMRWEGGELRRYRGRLYAMPGGADRSRQRQIDRAGELGAGTRPRLLSSSCRPEKAGCACSRATNSRSGSARAARASGRIRSGRASASRISARNLRSCRGCATGFRFCTSAGAWQPLGTSGSTPNSRRRPVRLR